jgi:hypothetical protein
MIERVIVPGDAAELKARQRVRYYPRQLMTADDMSQEQHYWREKLRRHNRFMHGWGVVCGLGVKQFGSDRYTITISNGYALSPSGDEIVVDEQLKVDLIDLWSEQNSPADPCTVPMGAAIGKHIPSLPTETTLFLAIRHCEHLESPIQVSPSSCGCVEMQCEYARILDACQIAILTELPTLYKNESQGKAVSCVPNCPASPQDDWIVLADIDANSAGKLTIKFTHRLVLPVDRATPCVETSKGSFPVEVMPEVGVSSHIESAQYINISREDGAPARVPVRFSVNAAGAGEGETLETLANREKSRRFFDPRTGEILSLGEIFDRTGVDKQTSVKSIEDINAVLRDKWLD